MTESRKKAADDLLAKVIAYGEEWARKNWVKDPSNPERDIRPTGEMKLEKAKEKFIAEAKEDPVLKKSLSELTTPGRLEDLIDAKLNLMRPLLSLPPGSSYTPAVSIYPAPGSHLVGTSKLPPPSSVAGLDALQTGDPLVRETAPGKKL